MDRENGTNTDMKIFEIKDTSRNLSPGGAYKIDKLLNETKD